MVALFPNPLKRADVIDPETGKIIASLIPVDSLTVTEETLAIDPTGLTHITETNLKAVIAEIDEQLGGGGSSIPDNISSFLDYNENPASLTSTNKPLQEETAQCLQINGTTKPEGNYKLKGTVYLNMSAGDDVTIGVYKNTTPTTTWTLVPNTYGTHGNNTYGRFINEITENVGTGKHKVEFETVLEGLVTGEIIGMFVKGTTTTANAIIGRTFSYEKTEANYYKSAINWDI